MRELSEMTIIIILILESHFCSKVYEHLAKLRSCISHPIYFSLLQNPFTMQNQFKVRKFLHKQETTIPYRKMINDNKLLIATLK